MMEVSSDVISEFDCVICRGKLDSSSSSSTSKDWVEVKTVKGLATLKEFSNLHHDDTLASYLNSNPRVVNVHVDCRKSFTNRRRYEQLQCRKPPIVESIPKTLRSVSHAFSWKEDCFYCGLPAVKDARHPERCDVTSVRTLQIRDRTLQMARIRSDKWGLEVQGRLEAGYDLVAEEAVYHKNCISAFFNNKSCPLLGKELPKPRPRSVADLKEQAFNNLCNWLEVSCDQLYSVSELHGIMIGMSDSSDDVYTLKHFRDKLLAKYNDCIVLSQISGKNDVVCFRDMASHILNDRWYASRQSDISEESCRIVTAAAKLIRSEIRQMDYSTTSYPLASSCRY
jgi:hypothetical protein